MKRREREAAEERAAAVWDELVRAARPAIEYVRWAAVTYHDNPARQELLDRLNTRWRDGEQPPRRALNY